MSTDERQSCFGSIVGNLKSPCQIVVIDADDTLMECRPSFQPFAALARKAWEKQAELSGDRFVGDKLDDIFKDCGILPNGKETVIVSTARFGKQKWWSLLGPVLTSGINNEEPRDISLVAEVAEWLRSKEFHGTREARGGYKIAWGDILPKQVFPSRRFN
jgi:hypothetical protein